MHDSACITRMRPKDNVMVQFGVWKTGLRYFLILWHDDASSLGIHAYSNPKRSRFQIPCKSFPLPRGVSSLSLVTNIRVTRCDFCLRKARTAHAGSTRNLLMNVQGPRSRKDTIFSLHVAQTASNERCLRTLDTIGQLYRYILLGILHQ
jgi:hypothetical protein